MRCLTLFLGILFAWLCLTLPAQAASSDPITRLISTRACVACDLQGADLKGLDLRGVNLDRANLQSANLSEAKLFGVEFKQANLQGANLTNADLLVVDFTQANLKGAKTSGINLDRATICHTITPDGSASNRDCD